MKRFHMLALPILVFLVFAMNASITHAQATKFLNAKLNSVNENPSVLTDGGGTLVLAIAPDGSAITFALGYSNLGGSATAAHIHLGKPWENGPVIVDLCALSTTATCEPVSVPPARVEGQIIAVNVQQVADPADPNRILLAAGDLVGLIQALTEGATYVNVHTDLHPSGEIRGNIE